MKHIASLLGTAALAFCTASHADVAGSLGTSGGSFLSLSSAGLAGGSVATLSGGTIYSSDQPFADIPKGPVIDFLAVGVTAGAPATLTFTTPVSYLSFLWGSPDLYNVLKVISTDGTQTFNAAGLGFTTTNGDQTVSQYVQFASLGASRITGVIFDNLPQQDAFEVANFTITAVPESATVALLAAGLGAVGLIVRRRRRVE